MSIEIDLNTIPDRLNIADESAKMAREIFAEVEAETPAEKAKAAQDMIRTAAALAEHGSDRVDGRGQMIGSIPGRIYFRWAQMLPGCWQDRQFVEEFLTDNPQCRAVGYKPREHSLRHGFTGIGAKFYHQNKAKVA